MSGYKNKNASKTVDVAYFAPVQLTALSPTATNGTTVGNNTIYGITTVGYTAKVLFKVSGATAIADCKIRALVNGSLAKEITYTTDGVKSDLFFNVTAEDDIVFEFSTTAAGAEIVRVDPLRIVFLAGQSEPCACPA